MLVLVAHLNFFLSFAFEQRIGLRAMKSRLFCEIDFLCLNRHIQTCVFSLLDMPVSVTIRSFALYWALIMWDYLGCAVTISPQFLGLSVIYYHCFVLWLLNCLVCNTVCYLFNVFFFYKRRMFWGTVIRYSHKKDSNERASSAEYEYRAE